MSESRLVRTGLARAGLDAAGQSGSFRIDEQTVCGTILSYDNPVA